MSYQIYNKRFIQLLIVKGIGLLNFKKLNNPIIINLKT
jgi:hypothetical protein